MRILYPLNPLNSKEADEPYQEEFLLLKSLRVECSLFDFDALEFDGFKPKPTINSGDKVLYRGWMLKPELYEKLTRFIQDKGGSPVTSYKNYLKCHHLPNWYDMCIGLTPDSVFFPDDEMLKENIKSLGWSAYFVKDYVKSNSTERGSIAATPEEVSEIVTLIKTYRGEIEGGIVIRRVENYVKSSEMRYFVFNGKAYSPKVEVPDIVLEIAKKIDAPFYSVDIVQRDDGAFRLVELGDGQVSDKKTWTTSKFSSMIQKNA